MASEIVKPGGPPGIVAVLQQEFHVSEMPSIGRPEAARRVLAEVESQGKRCELLSLSDQPVMRGALFDAIGSRVSFPEGEPYDRCYVALVDPTPAARWAHPACWAFVPADGKADVILQDTMLPENSAGPVRLLPMPIEP